MTPPDPHTAAAQARQRAMRINAENGDELLHTETQFTHLIPGPLRISVNTAGPGTEHDNELSLTLGPLTLGMSYEGGRELLHALLSELLHECYAAPIITLIERLPEDTFSTDGRAHLANDEEAARAAVRALWQAAHTFRHLWPLRRDGFDDDLWGVTPPPGVTRTAYGEPYTPPDQPDPAFTALRTDPTPKRTPLNTKPTKRAQKGP